MVVGHAEEDAMHLFEENGATFSITRRDAGDRRKL